MTTHGHAGLHIESWHLADYLAELLTMLYPPETRLLFALCGLFASPLIPQRALTGIAENAQLPESLLPQLKALSLLENFNSHTMSMHPLLHEYAADYIQHLPQYDTFLAQFVFWYAHYAAEQTGQYEELQSDFHNIQLAYDYAYETQDWESLYLLWEPITQLLWEQSRWTAYRQLNERYLDAAIACGDVQAEAQARSRLGWISFEEGFYEDAISNFQRVKDICDVSKNISDGIRVRRHFGVLYTKLGDLNLAKQYLHEAREMTLAAGQVEWADFQLALIAHAQANAVIKSCDYECAQSYSEQAQAHLLRTETLETMPMMQLLYGDILYLQGNIAEAAIIWRKVAVYGRDYHPEERIIAGAMQRLSQVEAAHGERERALNWAYEARTIYIQSNLTSLCHKMEAIIDKIHFNSALSLSNQWIKFELWD